MRPPREPIADRDPKPENVVVARPPDVFGASFLAAEWAKGVASVTGAPCPTPTGHELRVFAQLVDACAAEMPGPEWAQLQGAAFAKVHAGEKLNVFKFKDWIVGGRPSAKPAGKRGRRAVLQPCAPPSANAGNGGGKMPDAPADDALSQMLEIAEGGRK